MVSENELLKKYDSSFFEKDLSLFGISLNKSQICQFLNYYELLLKWNSFMNLTGITDYEEVMKKHFIDSLSILFCKTVDFQKIERIMDVGTGAGFPGIPLKIVFPDLQVTLLDSLQKRIKFLNTVIEELGLEKIHAIHGRAEDFGREDLFREKSGLVISRAVANLSILSEYCMPFVKKGGYFVSYKSENVRNEIEKAQKAIFMLGGKIKETRKFVLPNSDINRILVVIKKEKETPKRFPRKAGLPSKEPLS